MGELYPPTAADYAQSTANSAKQEIKQLQDRVLRLERLVELLMAKGGLKVK